jgi:hypothetical protein
MKLEKDDMDEVMDKIYNQVIIEQKEVITFMRKEDNKLIKIKVKDNNIGLIKTLLDHYIIIENYKNCTILKNKLINYEKD